MEAYSLGAMERRFTELIWEKEPIASGELVKLCEQELNWKKSTTYTTLRRLCEKGILQNQEGVVTSLLKKEELEAIQSEQFVEETFGGSLPQFVAAFTRRKKLSDRELRELEAMIARSREE